MDFQEVVRRRRMVRAYEDRPLPAELRDRILANAVHAPSAGFSQGWAFLVLEAAADRDRFWTLLADPAEPPDSWLAGMNRAPLLIVALSNKDAYLDRYAESDKGWTDRDEAHLSAPYWDIDTGFAALLMLLTAVDADLGACFFGIPPSGIDPFRTEFGVPGNYSPIGVISVGYRAPDRRSPSLKRGRRPVEDVTHFGHWSG
jgi:nitroreductase